MRNPFKYFNISPEVIRLAVMLYICYPPSLHNVEDLLAEYGVDICQRDRVAVVAPRPIVLFGHLRQPFS